MKIKLVGVWKCMLLCAISFLGFQTQSGATDYFLYLTNANSGGDLPTGSGTYNDPIKVGGKRNDGVTQKFDYQMNAIGRTIFSPNDTMTVHLFDGTYTTTGLAQGTDLGIWVGGPSHFAGYFIEGDSTSGTIIKLSRPNLADDETVAVIASRADGDTAGHANVNGASYDLANDFRLYNLTIDMDGANSTYASHPGSKTVPVWITCLRGYVSDIVIKNMFANGTSRAAGAVEAFGVLLWTGNWGLNWFGGPPVRFIYSTIDGFYSTGGGYCTGALVSTLWSGYYFDTDPSNPAHDLAYMLAHSIQKPDTYITSLVGTIYGCHAKDLTGNGYGANGNQILISQNWATNCTSGFNYDTGWSRSVMVTTNDFSSCGHGISFGAPSGWGNTNCFITRNTINIKTSSTGSWGILVQGSVGMTVTNNVLTASGSVPNNTTSISIRSADGNSSLGSTTGNSIQSPPFKSTIDY